MLIIHEEGEVDLGEDRDGPWRIRRATLWAFSDFGCVSSARTFGSVWCLVASCAAFRVLYLQAVLFVNGLPLATVWSRIDVL